jgi:hypothetical protein
MIHNIATSLLQQWVVAALEKCGMNTAFLWRNQFKIQAARPIQHNKICSAQNSPIAIVSSSCPCLNLLCCITNSAQGKQVSLQPQSGIHRMHGKTK